MQALRVSCMAARSFVQLLRLAAAVLHHSMRLGCSRSECLQ